jgi:hypothetical protein
MPPAIVEVGYKLLIELDFSKLPGLGWASLFPAGEKDPGNWETRSLQSASPRCVLKSQFLGCN